MPPEREMKVRRHYSAVDVLARYAFWEREINLKLLHVLGPLDNRLRAILPTPPQPDVKADEKEQQEYHSDQYSHIAAPLQEKERDVLVFERHAPKSVAPCSDRAAGHTVISQCTRVCTQYATAPATGLALIL